MKRIRIVQAALLIATAALLVSCSSGRQTAYSDPYPPSRPGFSLIIHSYPGMVVHRYHDGRFYYSSPAGYRYWRGYDNRYYLDRGYVNKVRYDRSQYNAWKHGHKKYYRKHHRR